MSQVLTINPDTGELVVSDRFTLSNTKPVVRGGEGPTTFDGLSETLSFFGEPNAPPPFLFVNNISNFTNSPRWGDWDTGGTDWTALSVYCTIVENNTNATDYISVGDTVMQANFETVKAIAQATTYYNALKVTKFVTGTWNTYIETPMEQNSVLLFAHKKIVYSAPAVQDMNLAYAYQTITHGEAPTGTPLSQLYYPLGCSMQVYTQDVSKATLPMILRFFLNVESTGITRTVSENWGYDMTYRATYKNKYPIRNAFRVNNKDLNFYAPVPNAAMAVRRIMEILLTYGSAQEVKNTQFQLAGPYSELQAITLAQTVCNSSAEPDLSDFANFCSCLGRKGVEDKLRSLSGFLGIRLECVSKMCQDPANALVFRTVSSTSCSKPFSGCMNMTDYNRVQSAITNFTNTCFVAPALPNPLLPPPPPAGDSTTGSTPPPPAGDSTTGSTPPPPTGGSTTGSTPPPPAGGSTTGSTPPPTTGSSTTGSTPPPQSAPQPAPGTQPAPESASNSQLPLTPEQSDPTQNLISIIGGSVGGIIAVIIIIVLAVVFSKIWKKRKANANIAAAPAATTVPA
jgi:hypothetical protein